MSEALVNDTLYVLLKNLYPSVSGPTSNIAWFVLFCIVTLILFGLILFIVKETAKDYFSQKRTDDVPGACICVFVLAVFIFAISFISVGIWKSYKIQKLDAFIEKVSEDKEAAERVEKIKAELVELNKDVMRFR